MRTNAPFSDRSPANDTPGRSFSEERKAGLPPEDGKPAPGGFAGSEASGKRERFSAAPDFVGDPADQLQLLPLVVLGEDIAFLGRGEAALGRDAELVERDILRSLGDAGLDRLGVLELGELGGEEAEHHDLILDFSERLEAAGALGVVLEEEAVHAAVREENLGDRRIGARGEPGRAEVAAADVHRDRHVGGLHFEDAVDRVHVALLDRLEVEAAVGVVGALRLVAEFAPGGVVELQVAAAFAVEGEDRVAVRLDDVVEQDAFILVALDRLIGAAAAHARNQVEHRGRGDRELDELAFARDRLQIAVLLQERMVAEADLAREDQLGALRGHALELDGPFLGGDLLHALEALEEVEVPERAGELAVGDGLEAAGLLKRDEAGDFAVRDFFERFARDLAFGELGAGFLHGGGAQEAADDVSAERGAGSFSHDGGDPFKKFEGEAAAPGPALNSMNPLFLTESRCGSRDLMCSG